eukprot:298143-Rhodomonas_salina.1
MSASASPQAPVRTHDVTTLRQPHVSPPAFVPLALVFVLRVLYCSGRCSDLAVGDAVVLGAARVLEPRVLGAHAGVVEACADAVRLRDLRPPNHVIRCT